METSAEPKKKLKKETFIRDFNDGEFISDIFVVKFKKPVQEYSRGYKFELRIGDSSGEIMLKFWGSPDKVAVEKIYDSIRKNDVIQESFFIFCKTGKKQIFNIFLAFKFI